MSRAGTRRDHERKKREEAFSVQSDAGISYVVQSNVLLLFSALKKIFRCIQFIQLFSYGIKPFVLSSGRQRQEQRAGMINDGKAGL